MKWEHPGMQEAILNLSDIPQRGYLRGNPYQFLSKGNVIGQKPHESDGVSFKSGALNRSAALSSFT